MMHTYYTRHICFIPCPQTGCVRGWSWQHYRTRTPVKPKQGAGDDLLL